ncbi:hypothetical protein QN277_017957 [Acacia crassicarpa]|uniref:Uncharacterized protein n=1 Tax=Acacia crassicarpa TaxID=499986 RepID=A0AAE1MS96_9FABA|nr:hypothetical protein QN277_017957 [Acacia crassicarpa]
MEQKKLPFRFRIPWISETSVPRPAAESSSRRPKKKSKLPFRPPGIAHIQKTESSSSSTSQNQHMKLMQDPKVGNSEDPVSGRQQVIELPLSTVFGGEKNQSEAPETVEAQMMFATSNPTGIDVKVLSSTNPKVSNVSCISHQKPHLPMDKAPLQEEIKDVSNCDHKLATENPFNVTTLAGDNRGATMNVGSKSGRKETLIPIYRAYKKNPEQRSEVAADGDESSEEEPGNSVENEIGNAYVNSNIQSLNNSLMCQSSINDRDPGVHMTLPQKHVELVKSDDKSGQEIRKPDVNVGRSDGVRIRRRCLRGLFAEPSDSDPDNPNKPQRHGCKFKCGDI